MFTKAERFRPKAVKVKRLSAAVRAVLRARHPENPYGHRTLFHTKPDLEASSKGKEEEASSQEEE